MGVLRDGVENSLSPELRQVMRRFGRNRMRRSGREFAMRWTPAAPPPARRVRRIGKTLLIGDCRARRFKRFRTVSKKPSRPRYRRSAAARPVRFDPTRTARSTLDRDRFWRYRRAMGRRGDRIRFGRYRIAHRAAPRGSRRTQKRPTSGLSCGGRSTLPPSSSARRAGRRPPGQSRYERG